jgi:phosphopantetheine--protein transferase-like protein
MNPHPNQIKSTQPTIFDLGTGLRALSQFQNQNHVMVFYDDGRADLEKTQLCLSKSEIKSAAQLIDPSERRHFIMRRAFQRHYLKMIIGFQGAVADLELQHHHDKAPLYPPIPDLSLTFSSSANHYVAASALHAKVGIDIETNRRISNPIEIAGRFFHPTEVNYLNSLAPPKQETEFLKLWTIKEACLKAIGRGVIYGLDTFVIRPLANQYRVDPPKEYGTTDDWRIQIESVLGDYWVTVAEFAPNRS